MARVHVDSAVTSRDDDLIAVYESTRLGRWADRFVGARCGLSLRRYGLSYEFFGGPRKRVLNPGSSERAHTAQVVRVARQGRFQRRQASACARCHCLQAWHAV